MWYGRTRASHASAKAIALALLVQDVVGTLACVELRVRGIVNWLGWTNIAGYMLLAVGYGYFFFAAPAEG